MLDFRTIQSKILGQKFKVLIKEKYPKMEVFAKEIGSSQPTLSSTLNGKGGADDYFIRVGKGLGLSDETIEKMFFESYYQAMETTFGKTFKEKISEKILTESEIDYLIMKLYNLSPSEFERLVRAIKS